MAISNAEIDSIANTAGYNDNGTGTVNYDFVPRTGGAVMTGDHLGKTTNNSNLMFSGGIGWDYGACVSMYGKDSTVNAGVCLIRANDGTNDTILSIQPSGTIVKVTNTATKNVAMQEDVIPRSGGAVFAASMYCRNIDNSELIFCGGHDYGYGGNIFLAGKDNPGIVGGVVGIRPDNGTTTHDMWFTPDGSWTWNGSAVQITSDQRYKQQINAIDDKLLDAWKDVAPVQFKYNDSVEEKGDKARLHTGYVVQQIAEACQNHDVDIDNYGLYCHEVYENDEHYSLRYTEALIVECAFLRREVERLTERVTKLESRKKRTTA
jgi:hypothetical protein